MHVTIGGGASIDANLTSAAELLRLPLDDHQQPSGTSTWGVRARAFGQRLAIAVSVQANSFRDRGVRVLSLDAPAPVR
jgi:hypothetical protein